jgi:hypothetical protein
MVWQAKKAGSTQLNFVPTHHWLPPRGSGASAAGGVGSFCLMTGSNGSPTCVPWTQELINQFRDGMSLCFAEALRQGITIYVRPHLDDGTGAGSWRNGLLFKPAEKYGGFSYDDIMLAPLADALNTAYKQAAAEQVLPPNPVVYFGLQGEMSATIMRHPGDWGALTSPLRNRILGGDSNLVSVKMGVGMNFNRLDDVTSTNQQFGSSRLSWLFWSMDPEGSGRGAPDINTAALQSLFASQLDFVGISAYAPVSGPGLRLQEFENSAFEFGNDMASYGVDIAGLVNSGQLELQYSEFGIGGGNSYSGLTMARSPSEVALRPFFGVYGVYQASEDPWRVPANKAFLREYYTKALQWLADPSNKTYKVSAAFIWSMNSWDVLGIYPESTSAQGTYEDPAIVDMVVQHNLRMRGQVPGPAAGVVAGPAAPSGAPVVVVQAGK